MSEAHAPPKHPYHLVAPSVWPLVGAIAAGLITTGGVLYMHGYGWTLLIIGVLGVLATMAVWWRDVIREATFQGYHTPVVQLGLRYGMALFIASEVMFFAAFFWAFFASSLFPVGGVWPPKTIHPFDPFEFPFLNTLILLLSGTTVLGPPFLDRGQPHRAAAGFGADRLSRHLLHLGPGLGVQSRAVPLHRRDLPVDIL